MSPGPTVTCRWSPMAIRPSALIGSPCEPVDISTMLVRRQRRRLIDADDQPGRDAQQAEVAGDAHVAHHGPADEGDIAAVLLRRVEHLLHPVHMRGERRDDDPPGRPSRRSTSSTGPISRSGVTKPGISALVESDSSRSTPAPPSRANPARSVSRPSSGSWSILKSPVCSTMPAGVRDRDRERVRDRVVDREELALERAQPLRLPFRDGQRVGLDPPLGELRLDQGEGELGPDQRNVRLVGEQVRHRADVVLVAVGQHDRLDVVQPVQDRRRSRAGSGRRRALDVGEEHPAVDDQQLAVVLENGHVATDGAEPAERDDPQPTLAAGAAGEFRCSASGHTATHPSRQPAPSEGSFRSRPAAAQSCRSRATSVGGRVDQRGPHRPGG